MSMEQQYNLVEGIFWIIVGAILLVQAVRCDKTLRGVFFAGSLAFVFFGISDFVEMRTGAWYRPWWLLVWKGSCLGVFVAVFMWYRKVKVGQEGNYDEENL